MRFRVSEAEQYRQWLNDEDMGLETLLARLRGESGPSEAMQAGTAFHRALELATPQEARILEAEGYTFRFDCDGELALADTRELRSERDYGGIVITGQVDVLSGLRIEDHKTTSQFDADRYLSGYQWRFYLDIFGAKTFRWNVFEIHEEGPRAYSVMALHRLEQHAYPGMHADCAALAQSLRDFAAEHMLERLEAA